LPTTFINDRLGTIQYVHTWAITFEPLQAMAEPLF
jgi:hypothetical protein